MVENNKDGKSESGNNRKVFLLHMYDQMFNDINRHIIVVWQCVGFLIGAFALFGLVEKQIMPLDIATTLIILIGVWLLAHLQDAGYWYNRNLVIIANIERQFLKTKDLSEIQYYFGKHRKDNKMLTHLKIQCVFGIAVVMLVTIYHFFTRVFPGIGAPWKNFEPVRALPYLFFIIGSFYLIYLWKKRKANYKEFLQNSPGSSIDTTGIEYGDGHPSD